MTSKDPNEPSIKEALKTVKIEDLKNIPQIPCARNSLLYGIGGGAGFGAIRFLARRSVPSAANWAVGSFCAIATISFEMCQMDRRNTVTKLKTKINEIKTRERSQIVEERDRSGALSAVIELPEHLKNFNEKKDE
ncbi:hypothetical protein K450DRAFT_232836 [Umbelopsis ramanniana AG]|uniref:Cytochrome c oxidase assembly protein COX20, mitochondrial n=1 Tax=Umbelopsis ramanniana AG TaxID=1314678 RepID=A0AAD5EDG8_UMBRA|nr:uncharacterized protein K450DRAFT_232836 [Umbelopsis ramanniana AG]KAI8581392.1 hypothetical protein K450DRAFT_232836 [Umbelopsis ramanniana AG]